MWGLLRQRHTAAQNPIEMTEPKTTTARGSRSHTTRLLAALNLSVSELLYSSFRYYLGRKTAAAGSFAEDLARAWAHVEQPQRDGMLRELMKAFAEDDRMRDDPACDSSYYPLGHDCDRDAWQKVLNAASGRCMECGFVSHQCICSHDS